MGWCRGIAQVELIGSQSERLASMELGEQCRQRKQQEPRSKARMELH